MDRLAVKAIAILALAAVLTVRQLPVWSSNVALWSAAVRVNTASPRPAFNLGLSYQLQGDYGQALSWFELAVERADGTPAAVEYQGRVRTQVAVMESFGIFPCATSDSFSFCR